MVRTVFPAPGLDGEAYFFHGAKYARIKFRPSSPDEEIVFGPTAIAREWKTRKSNLCYPCARRLKFHNL